MPTAATPMASPRESAAAIGREERLKFRSGSCAGPTAGLALGNVQANLVIVPADLAMDFLRFAQANPKPCPVLAVSEPGAPGFPSLGDDIDMRTDLPRYVIWRDGEPVEQPTDIRRFWRDDLVGFAIGCSFSFEEALLQNEIEVRHLRCGLNVPMYRTNIRCASAGKFHGPLVVSMRPLRPDAAIRAVQITSRFPSVHGAPVHIGLPEMIGIEDLNSPDYGDAVPIYDDELPVFWACGVTPQAAIVEARPEFCITHAPGCMLITDRLNAQLGGH
jgi:uncharacterized protein YcsI (UPF0317 family)